MSFVVRAKHGDNEPNYPGFMDELFKLCDSCLHYQERFNQLGVGWLLREMSLATKDRTVDFIERNQGRFIPEGLRYAIEKL